MGPSLGHSLGNRYLKSTNHHGQHGDQTKKRTEGSIGTRSKQPTHQHVKAEVGDSHCNSGHKERPSTIAPQLPTSQSLKSSLQDTPHAKLHFLPDDYSPTQMDKESLPVHIINMPLAS
jgi:hypothetical protein